VTTSNQTDVRDMAIIHQTFRNAFHESAALVRANPTPSPQRVEFLAEHIDFAIAMLHDHHEGEDELLYPLLAERVPEQLDTVNAIEAQHKEVTGAINAVSAACAGWRRNPSAETGESLAALLVELNDILQPHLDDEEQTIVPLAADHLTQREWDALGDHGIAGIPKKKLPVAFGLITDPLNEADAAYMKAHLPPPVRLLFPVLIARPWRKYADTLRHGS
jgi:hemerythrin-like domain-containing protein